jgi:hypothetical protein
VGVDRGHVVGPKKGGHGGSDGCVGNARHNHCQQSPPDKRADEQTKSDREDDVCGEDQSRLVEVVRRSQPVGTDPLGFALAVSDDNFVPMIDPA